MHVFFQFDACRFDSAAALDERGCGIAIGSGIATLVESTNSASVGGSPVALAQEMATASIFVSPQSKLSLSLSLLLLFSAQTLRGFMRN